MKKLIYAYRIKDSKKVVYIGQTNNLEYRRKQHEIYDIENPKQREYNYPLSRGIRKHGIDYYECIVLEETENWDEREKYWIDYYDTFNNGYNQTEGGQLGKYLFFSEELIQEVISLLKYSNKTFKEISEETGISVPMLSEINTGVRRRQPNETYPLKELTHGRKLTNEDLLQIKDLLENSQLPMTQIAQCFNVCPETIRKINKGSRNYSPDWEYPLRKKNTWKY